MLLLPGNTPGLIVCCPAPKGIGPQTGWARILCAILEWNGVLLYKHNIHQLSDNMCSLAAVTVIGIKGYNYYSGDWLWRTWKFVVFHCLLI